MSGVGSIGSRHARLLASRDDVELRLFDAVPTAGFGGSEAWAASFDALLDDGLDGLVVATPDPSHAVQVEAACRRGVAVLVEKPLAASVAEGVGLAEVARGTDTPVLVGYVLRYTAVLQRVRELLEAEALGTVVSGHVELGAYETLVLARNRFAEPGRHRILFDYSHEWDYLGWLVGQVERVAATMHCSGDLPLREDPNVVDGLLEFTGGATGSFHLDYVQAEGVREVTLIGDRGSLRADVRVGEIQLRGPAGRVERLDESRDASFGRQLDHFLAVCRGAESPRVTVADGIRALAVSEAIVEACEGRAWVDVPA